MQPSNVLLMPMTVAFLVSAMPAQARYTEHWLTSTEVAQAQPQPASARKSSKKLKQSQHPEVSASAVDDPIAAFAHDPRPRRNTARR